VRGQVEPVQPEVQPQRFDVLDLSIAPVGRRVVGDGGLSGAPQVQHHQWAVGGQSAEVTQVGRGLHAAAGQADERAALAGPVVGEWRAVPALEGLHGRRLAQRFRPGE
jgi:hypothetical protein